MRIPPILFALLALSPSLSAATPPSIPAADAQAVEIHLEPAVAGLKTVPVTIGGETLPFLLDTGGGVTVITPAVAKSAGCSPFGRIAAFRAVGERLDLPRCGPVRLSLGGRTIDTETALLDLMPMMGPKAPVIGGLISLGTLRDRPFTLDLAHDRLILETDASLTRRVPSMHPLSVRTAGQGGGAAVDLFVEVRAKTGTLWLEMDSGNAGPVMLAPHALRQLGIELPAASDGQGKAGDVALDFLGLGPVAVAAVEKPIIYDGLLNAATLTKMVLTVDLKTGRAWATF